MAAIKRKPDTSCTAVKIPKRHFWEIGGITAYKKHNERNSVTTENL